MSNDPKKMLSTLRGKSAKTAKWASDSQNDGKWNESLLKVTLNEVRQGKSDAEIHDLTDDLTTDGFSVKDTRKQVQKMLDGARNLIPATVIEAEREIENISRLGDVSYQLQRKDVAKRLGITVSAIDRLRKQKQLEQAETATVDIVEPVSPWPDPVNAVKMADYIELTIKKHIALRHSEYATAITLWSLSTWLIDAWKIMPHLFFRSLTKGSGKTTALHIVEALAARSYVAANITPAALFRVIEQNSPTLLLDEVDRYLAQDEVLNGIMNAGHTRRTATVTRLEEVDGDYIPRKFNVFGGKCMAGIGKQLDTCMDRSIIVKMEKRLSDERVTKLPLMFFENHFAVRRKIARFAEDNTLRAKELEPVIPNLGNDRAQDNWLPLFIVAELIGGAWPEKCLAAYKKIEELSAEDAKDQETVVLRILRELAPNLEKQMGSWLPAAELRSILISNEESEFFDWYQGNPITAKSIKKYLAKEAGVAHERQSSGSVYSLPDIRDLVDRYVR
jgi:hypothetical protein